MKSYKYRESMKRGNAKPVIIDGVRTPFVRSFGVFQSSDALELYTRVVDRLLRKLDFDYHELDEVSCGVVVPQTKNGNVARDTVINLRLPGHIHGYTLNRACTSSMQTIADAARSIISGNPHLVIAGGVECLSDVPIAYSREARDLLAKFSRAKSAKDKITLLREFNFKAWLPQPPAIKEPLTGFTMGEHAEMMAKKNKISQREQDELALASHLNAAKAQEKGYFEEEIVPTFVAPHFNEGFAKDNLIRSDTTLEKLSSLKPAFDRKFGTITPGNASGLTDGASCVLVADEERAKSLGLKAKSRIVDVQFVGIDPYDQLLIGPAIAIPLLLKKNGLQLKDIDLFEIHEAFAAQVLSCLKAMASREFCEEYFGDSKAFGELPRDRLNVNGGAIAIGHPFGATGSRLALTLSNELIRRKGRYGVIAICAAGGMAGAMLIENSQL